MSVEELNVLKMIFAKILEMAERGAVRTNRTKMVEVDLTAAHTDEPLGLEVSGRIYRWLTIERCDSSLTYKLKQTDGSLSDPFTAYKGARITHHDFLDIIISNPIGTGICRFIVGYREG